MLTLTEHLTEAESLKATCLAHLQMHAGDHHWHQTEGRETCTFSLSSLSAGTVAD